MKAEERIALALSQGGRPFNADIRAILSELASLRSEREGMREGLKDIGIQAEDSAFVAAAVEPNERSIVILGKRFQAIQDRARALLHQGEGETP